MANLGCFHPWIRSYEREHLLWANWVNVFIHTTQTYIQTLHTNRSSEPKPTPAVGVMGGEVGGGEVVPCRVAQPLTASLVGIICQKYSEGTPAIFLPPPSPHPVYFLWPPRTASSPTSLPPSPPPLTSLSSSLPSLNSHFFHHANPVLYFPIPRTIFSTILFLR